MTIPFGPFHLHITVSRAKKQRRYWEVMASAGMDDRELAQLNRHNIAWQGATPWDWPRHVVIGQLHT